jgi:hypothetical protein
MKKLLPPLIIILLAVGAVFAVHTWNVDTAEPVVAIESNNVTNTTQVIEEASDPIATLLSTTTAAGDTFIIDPSIPIEDRCTPVTLACLEAQPEWNPTVATTGINRIDPSELTLFDGTYELDYQPVPRSTDPFTLVTAKDQHDPAYCDQYDLSNFNPNVREGYNDVPYCSIYPPEAYQEFVILDENDEVVHAYRLTENYSLLHYMATVVIMGQVSTVGAACCSGPNDLSLSLTPSPWGNFATDITSLSIPSLPRLNINPFTGELTTDD